MPLVIVATIASALALLSGIFAIGKGHHWNFSKADIVRGRRNAVLYVWVTFSSIFSLGHFAQLLTYGIENKWLYQTAGDGRWMVIHTGFAVLLISAHLYILKTLSREGAGDDFVWGSTRVR